MEISKMPSEKLNLIPAKTHTEVSDIFRPGVRGIITTYDTIKVELLDGLCQADVDQLRISDGFGRNLTKPRMATTPLFTSTFMMMKSDKPQSTKRAKYNYGHQSVSSMRPSSERANAYLGSQKIRMDRMTNFPLPIGC